MKRGTIWILVTWLIVVSLILVSCTKSTTTSTSTPNNVTSTASTTSSTIVIPTSTTSTSLVNTTTTTSTTGNWWDSLGTPQYGGVISLSMTADIGSWDPYQGQGFNQIFTAYTEQLFSPNWTMDPAMQNYQIGTWDSSFAGSTLLQSWEFTDPSTQVLTLKQGIYWQNIAPSYGREFTATDIVDHFDRMCGLGNGFTTMGTYWVSASAWTYIQSVTATSKYVVTMKWSISNPEYILENIISAGAQCSIEDPDAVSAYTTSSNPCLTNWHNAIGTGPFILTDYVNGSSIKFVKNTNYHGFDERYPQNQLPYVNNLNIIIIPNAVTALAALRAGKLDVCNSVTSLQIQNMNQTNPEILSASVPGANHANTIDPRDDMAPFNNLNVRIALQEAIDLPTIAKAYYAGGVSPLPSTLTSEYLAGLGWPYADWPASLQAQYAYNPTNAKALLAAAGYSNGLNTTIAVNNGVDMSLFQIVQSYFSTIGVNLNVTVMDQNSFNNYVVTNHANQGLVFNTGGQLALNYGAFIQFLRFYPGNAANYMMINDPAFTHALDNAMASTTTDQVKQILLAANQEVAEQHFVISLLIPPSYSLYEPSFKGFNAQYGSTSGGSGPNLAYFYDARFWIVQN